MQQELNLPNIKMMIDYYQMRSMNEVPEILWTARKQIVHSISPIPTARATTRSGPKTGRKQGIHPLLSLVKKIDYRGGISIEANDTYEESAAATLAFLRKELT